MRGVAEALELKLQEKRVLKRDAEHLMRISGIIMRDVMYTDQSREKNQLLQFSGLFTVTRKVPITPKYFFR